MENAFYTVVRILRKVEDGTFFNSTFDHTDLMDAWSRHFAGFSTYLTNDTYDYVASYIIRSDGAIVDWKAFDKTA